MTKKLDEATKLANKQKALALKQKEANKAFNKLNKTQKRLAIIEDSLLQIKKEKFIAKQCTYFPHESIIEEVEQDKWETTSVQTLLPTIECKCCAKGALLLSTINKRNRVTVQDLNDLWVEDDFIKDTISDIFSPAQLDLIETAFEKTVVTDSAEVLEDCNCIPTSLGMRAIEFGQNYPTDKGRLIAILKNMKSNNGIFKP